MVEEQKKEAGKGIDLSSYNWKSAGIFDTLPNISKYEGEELVVKGIETRNGNYGKYVILDVTVLETGEEIKVQTGARLIVEKLEYIRKRGDLPIVVTPCTTGRQKDIR